MSKPFYIIERTKEVRGSTLRATRTVDGAVAELFIDPISMSVRCSRGSEEAQALAQMFERLYLRYTERNGMSDQCALDKIEAKLHEVNATEKGN